MIRRLGADREATWTAPELSLAVLMRYANDMPRTTIADTELASSMRIAVMRLARRLRAERSDSGLTLTQTSALSALERLGPCTPGELASNERVQPPSMTRVLSVLEERGLITRVPHPTDRRQVLVAVTETAREMLREDRRRREAWLVDHLAGLTPDERAVLRLASRLLDRLAAQ
jgi:DNA-binding MarR family transcriptional regulator